MRLGYKRLRDGDVAMERRSLEVLVATMASDVKLLCDRDSQGSGRHLEVLVAELLRVDRGQPITERRHLT